MDDNLGIDAEEDLNDNSGGDMEMDNDSEEEQQEQYFDKSLAASHSYMGTGLVPLSGRSVLEPGWRGRVPVAAHTGAVFPGETVPMMVPNPHDAVILARVIRKDKLFGLLCPDAMGGMVSGFGVLCEVFEAGPGAEGPEPQALTFKARARHRFRLMDLPNHDVPIQTYSRMRFAEVRVLPEVQPNEPLWRARLSSPDALRRARTPLDRRRRALDGALTPWPLFVYDAFDFQRMRDLLRDHFKSLKLDRLPEEPVALSFWVASNLALSAHDRLALFMVDDALQRLHMELRFIARKSILCCSTCSAEIARREHIFAMSSDGVHSNYTNLGGYMHDLVTVSRTTNTHPTGRPSTEYSWFPGYAWTIVVCVICRIHAGWRFDAVKRSLRPLQFFGLCRNNVQPRADDEPDRL